MGTEIPTMKDTFVSRDGTTTCDKKQGRTGEAPELICRRCLRSVCSEANAKRSKWVDAADVHAKEKCRPAQVSWQYRPVAPALAAPELRGLVFVARGCVDQGLCVAAVCEAKEFTERSWDLIDPREDGEGMCDNRRQRVVHQGGARQELAGDRRRCELD